jgi:hypothetical protein
MNLLYGDRGFEFIHVTQMGLATAEDEVWANAFMKFGGKIAISADRNIAKKPHKLLAFSESKLKAYFMLNPWSRQKLNYKAAHLVYWWSAIEKHLSVCVEGECWEVPFAIKGAEFKPLKVPDVVIQKILASKAGI